MKITAVDAFVCPPQWTFVRIRTDEGITGWGEAGMQFRARAVQAAIHDLRGLLVGADPTRIEAHWQVIRRSSFLRGGPILSSAQAAVDIALWDIVGKLHGVPIHELLGGPVRDRVRAYVWIAGDDLCDFSPEEIVAETTALGRAGVHGVQAHSPEGLRRRPAVARARDRRSRSLRFARRSAPTATLLSTCTATGRRRWHAACVAALEPLDLLFVEEPVLAENLHVVRELTQGTTLPIATGERLYSRWEFADVVQSGVAVIQPDVSQAGGISELRRIAAMAETYDVTVAPHCPLGPVTLAASLQIDFATPNILIQEQGITFFGDDFLRYITNPEVFDFHDGYWDRPTGPGLGIDVDEGVVERMAEIGHDRKQPIWWHTDGSYAEF